MAVKLSNFRQLAEAGQDSFLFEAKGDDNKYYLFFVYPNQSYGFFKPRAIGLTLGMTADVAARYEINLPTAGFENQDTSQPNAVRVPLPAGVQIVNLNVGDSGVAWVPDFLPTIGFTTPGDSPTNLGSLPTVTGSLPATTTGTQLDPYAMQLLQQQAAATKENAISRNAKLIAEDPIKWATDNPVLAIGLLFALYQLYNYLTAKDAAAKKKTLIGKFLKG
jgi:hypothetical protein